METFVKKCNEANFYTSNLIAAAERRSVMHEQSWLTGRSCIQSKSVMTNVGRRQIFVQFHIKEKNTFIRDHREQEDKLDGRNSGPGVTAGKV